MSLIEKTIQYLSYLFLFFLPWQTILIFEERFVGDVKWEYGTIGMYGTEMLGWVVVLFFMVWYVLQVRGSGFRGKDFRWSRDRLFVLSLLLFTGYSLLVTGYSLDSQLAWQHAQRILLGSLLFLMFYIGPVKPRHALWAFVLGSVPVSVLGMWQFFVQSTFASTLLGLSTYAIHEPGASIIASESIGRWLRAYGSFSHPNVFGGYLAFAILSSLLLYRSSVRWGRVLLSAIVALQLVALFFTFSRSAWLAVGMVTLLYCYIVVKEKTFRHLLPAVSVLLAFCIFSFTFFSLVQTRLSAASVNEVTSITERADGYQQAVNVFIKRPLVGFGGGIYTYALMHQYPDYPGWWYQPVHNAGVLFAVEYGLIGVLLALFVVVSFFRYQMIDNRHILLFAICYLPLVLLDHYLWSSYVGLMFLFVYTAVYFRYFPPHIVPK